MWLKRLSVNVHYYPTRLRKTLQLSHPLANACAVVSERSPRTEIPVDCDYPLCWAPYDGLVDACIALLDDEGRQVTLRRAGQASLRERSIVLTVAHVLGILVHGPLVMPAQASQTLPSN